MKDCLEQAVTDKIGYEAELASVHFAVESINESGLRIKISGYSQKILDFAECFFSILFECADPTKAFDRNDMMNSLESVAGDYANDNQDVKRLANHNRQLVLLPHKFSDLLVSKVLHDKL